MPNNYSRDKDSQNKISSSIKKLEGNYELIQSTDNINSLDKQLNLSKVTYDEVNLIFDTFEKNYNKIENFYNQNPKTKLNLIFTEYKLLKTEFNNQQKIINESFQQISNFHTKRKRD